MKKLFIHFLCALGLVMVALLAPSTQKVLADGETELTPGVLHNDFLPGVGEKYYKVTVDSGEHLFIILDADDNLAYFHLYIKFASPPTATDYDDKGDSPYDDQAVEIADTQEGTYYIMIDTSGGYFTIVAHNEDTFSALSLGIPSTVGMYTTQRNIVYYQIAVTTGEHLFVVLDASFDNHDSYDLYIKFASLPTTTDYDDKGDSPNADQAVEIASTQAGNYYVMVIFSTFSVGFNIVAHTSATFPTLSLGKSQASSFHRTGDIKYFQVSVSSGKHLFIILDADGNTNSHELYVKFASLPTMTDYDFKGNSPNADQAVEIASTQAGNYYIMTRSADYNYGGGFTITAHTGSAFPTLTPGISITGEDLYRYDIKYYKVKATAGEHLFITLDAHDSGDSYDLYIKFDSLPTISDYDCKGTSPYADQAVEVANAQEGYYYVMVRSNSTRGNGDFTIIAHNSATFPTLSLGTIADGILYGKYDVKYYQVSVTAGEHLFFILNANTNDGIYGLYIKFASLPTTLDYDFKGNYPKGDQSVEIANAQEGTYYVMVDAASESYTDFTIVAHNNATFPTLSLGTSKKGPIYNTYDTRYYKFSATAGQHLFIILDADYTLSTYGLYVKFASLPTTTDYDFKGNLPKADQAVEIASTQAGYYYIMLRSISSAGYVSFNIVVHTDATFPGLSLGKSIADTMQGTYDVKYYQISVSAGKHLFVILDGEDNGHSYDLYIKFASLPTTTDYDDKGDSPNADQALEIASSQKGVYYIMVRSTSGKGSFNIVVHTDATFPTLSPGKSTARALQGTNDVKYYQVSVSAGKRLVVILDGKDNNNSYALYIKFASLPTTTDYNAKGDSYKADQTVSVANTKKGIYYIMVRSSSGGGNFTIVPHYQFTATFNSIGAQDGWILETSETSGRGGTRDSTASTFQLGDDASDRQYRAILSFNTASLPDGAIIRSAVLKIKQSGSPVGSNPFSILWSLDVGIRKGYFSSSPSLQEADFDFLASAEKTAVFGKTPSSGWYSATLTSTGRKYINKTSLTQFRLAFARDDNDDKGADYMKFISGNASRDKPQLLVTYFSP